MRLKCPVFSLNVDLRLDTQDKKKLSLSTQRRKVLKPLAIDLRLINSRVDYDSVSLSSCFLSEYDLRQPTKQPCGEMRLSPKRRC